MVHYRQGVRYTKPKPRPSKTDAVVSTPEDNQMLLPVRSNGLHIHVRHISKIYTDDCGQLPVRARSGNQHVMVAYHFDSSVILVAPFNPIKDTHHIATYNSTM